MEGRQLLDKVTVAHPVVQRFTVPVSCSQALGRLFGRFTARSLATKRNCWKADSLLQAATAAVLTRSGAATNSSTRSDVPAPPVLGGDQ